jgi:hypothetical protein
MEVLIGRLYGRHTQNSRTITPISLGSAMRMGSPEYTDAANETIKSMRQYFHDLEILIRKAI